MMTLQPLPSFVINQSELEGAERDWRQTTKRISLYLQRLREIKDLPVPQEPKKVTTKWLAKFIASKCKEVNNMPLPGAEKERLERHWLSVESKAKTYVSQIEGFCSMYDVEQEADGSIYVPNIYEVLSQQCRKVVPDQANEHFRLFCEIRNAIKFFREYEQTHSVKQHNLADLLLYVRCPDDFAEMWANGSFSHPCFSRYDVNGEASENLRLREVKHRDGLDYNF